MQGALEFIFEWINGMLSGLLTGTGGLTAGLKDGIPALYSLAAPAQKAVLPVGYTILALFFLVALCNAARRTEAAAGGATMGVQMIVGILVKLILCKLIMDNADVLIGGLLNVANYITQQIGEVVDGGDVDLKILDAAAYASLGFFSKLAVLLMGIVTGLIVLAVTLVARIMIYLRWIELYLYMILAPVPLATLPDEEWSQIGKNFLKSFLAVAIQGTVLFLTLTFFPAVANAVMAATPGSGLGGTLAGIVELIFISFLLLFAVFGSSRVAKSICSAM